MLSVTLATAATSARQLLSASPPPSSVMASSSSESSSSSSSQSEVNQCAHTQGRNSKPSFKFEDISTVEPMMEVIISRVRAGYRPPSRIRRIPELEVGRIAGDLRSSNILLRVPGLKLPPKFEIQIRRQLEVEIRRKLEIENRRLAGHIDWSTKEPSQPTNKLVVVKGWDGVGSGTLMRYATSRIGDALKRYKEVEKITYGFRIVKVNIPKEDRSGASAASKIRQELDSVLRSYSPSSTEAGIVYSVVIVNSDGPLREISLEGLLPRPALPSAFIIPALRVKCGIDTSDITTVERAFDTLSDEEALWLLQDEAQCIADAVCQRRHRVMALECFLYCTLVPQLFDPRHCWMAEGLLGGEDSLEYYSPEAERLAHDLMTEFHDRCMLQISDMHNYDYKVRVPQPLVQKIIKAFLLTQGQWARGVISKHSSGLTEFPLMAVEGGGRKAKDVRRISLANNCIRQLLIPAPGLPEYFPNLCTLLLNDNPQLDEIPDDVFSPQMPNLRLLDLSGTSIAKLPSSLSNCVNLRMLSLNRCMRLETLFPIFETCLEHLEVLSLVFNPLNNITNLSIPYRPNLKVLRFCSAFDKLEKFNISVDNGRVFEEYLAPKQKERYWKAPIKNAHIIVSHLQDARTRERSNLIQKEFPLYKSVLDQINSNVYPRLTDIETSYNRHLEIHGGQENVLGYNIAHSICFPDFISLCDSQIHVPINLDDFKELRSCRIERCQQMTTVFSLGLEETQLKNVYLSLLGRIECMCSSIVGTLAHLRSIRIEGCNNLLFLFTGSAMKLPMLEELEIEFCAKFQSIFGEETDCSRARGESNLPKLQRLHLCELPNMTSICDGYLPSVQVLKVRGCWKLRKLPLATIAIDATTDPIVKVIKVEGEQGWWNSVVGNEVFHKTKIKFVMHF